MSTSSEQPLVDFTRLSEIEQTKVRKAYQTNKAQLDHAFDPQDYDFFFGAVETFENAFGKANLNLPFSDEGSPKNMCSIPAPMLNEFLFCTARYCIGRHSYVSTYASDIWQIIQDNIDNLNHKRLAFFARDIRAEISERMSHYFSHITVENGYNSSIVKDAHTLLCEYLQQHPEIEICKTKFQIDCLNCTVQSEPYEPKPNDCVVTTLAVFPDSDLSRWSALANKIDILLKEKTNIKVRKNDD